MRLALLLLLGCDSSDERDMSSLSWETVEVSCEELIYHDHFLIVAIDDAESVVTWMTGLNDGDAWTLEPDAAYLYDGDPAVFVLAGADYCPLDSRLKLSWLW